MSSRIEDLHPLLAPWARWLIGMWPYGQLTSTWRSRREQEQLYAAFLRGESHYPAAPPGHSKHELGLAFDYLAPDYILADMGAVWESVGGHWGGCCGDNIHFEA